MNSLEIKPSVFAASKCLLGEGPVWDSENSRLLWVDILRGELWCADEKSARILCTLKTHLGAVAIRADGSLIAATREGIGLLDGKSGEWTRFAGSPIPKDGERFNDGKMDPSGRFWAGTLTYQLVPGAASLFRMDSPESFTKVVSDVTISNGLAWDLPRRLMYYIDTATQKIDCFDFDPETGEISSRRTVVEVPAGMGYPDGMCIAPDGTLWVALWDGWTVANFDPKTGSLIQKISLPVERPTSCCLGGMDGKTLFITSSCDGFSAEELSKQPAAGSVFSVSLSF